MPAQVGEKSFMVTWLLSLFLGLIGADRFYVGKVGTGILKLITFGGLGLWYIIDLIIILTGSMRDKDGDKLNGYGKNKTIALIATVVFIAVVGVGGASITNNSSDNEQSPASSGGSTTSEKKKDNKPKWDINAVYNKIETGMTKAEVEKVTGKTSDDCSETSAKYVGKMESCNYGGLGDSGIIIVGYDNNKVSSKSKSTY